MGSHSVPCGGPFFLHFDCDWSLLCLSSAGYLKVSTGLCCVYQAPVTEISISERRPTVYADLGRGLNLAIHPSTPAAVAQIALYTRGRGQNRALHPPAPTAVAQIALYTRGRGLNRPLHPRLRAAVAQIASYNGLGLGCCAARTGSAWVAAQCGLCLRRGGGKVLAEEPQSLPKEWGDRSEPAPQILKLQEEVGTADSVTVKEERVKTSRITPYGY